MFRWPAVGAGALLGAFHLWVLGNQAWTGQLTDPDVGLRWLAAAGIVVGLMALRRRGVPLLFSRHAVAMWVLATLLHGPALANGFDGLATPSLPEAVATVGQVAASISALALALLALFTLRLGHASPLAGLRLAIADRPARALEAGTGLDHLPRPPPRS